MKVDRTLFRRCRTYNEPSHLPADGSQIAKALAIISAGGLTIASAGFGAVYGYTIGVQHGALMAALTVAFALALEIAKPLAVHAAFESFRSWRTFGRGLALATLGIVAVGYSLCAELALTASSRSDLVAKREAASDTTQRAREKHDRAKAELATIKPARPVQEVEALVAGAAPVCRVVVTNGTRSTNCTKPPALLAELGRAKRKAELETMLAGSETQLATGPAVKSSDPGPAAIATYLSSVGVVVSVPVLSQWLNLLAVLGLELGSALGLVLVQAVSGERREAVRSGQTPDAAEGVRPAEPDTMPVGAESPSIAGSALSAPLQKRTPRRRADRRPAGRSIEQRPDAVVDLLKARGGQIKSGQRQIARALRVSKSRANELLHEAAAAGTVTLATSRSGTTVVLAAA